MLKAMTAVRGILIKQFGGPEVLEYATNIPTCAKPASKQVCYCDSAKDFLGLCIFFFLMICLLAWYCDDVV
jgi:hypothetical protein